MKSIKYRQYLKESLHYNGVCFHYWGYIDGAFISPVGRNECVVESEQFTGLKDSEGVDIYEGDIVSKYGKDTSSKEYQEWCDNTIYTEDGFDEKLEAAIPIVKENTDIVTMERFPCYWLKNETFGYEGDDLQWHGEYSVIGNIHQNPELLTKD